jgi:protein ImuB
MASPASLRAPTSSAAPAFAVLRVPDFALQAALRLPPGAAEPPAALVDPTAPGAPILAFTATAQAAGVEPGFTVPQALARCPHLQIRHPHPEAEAEARAALLAAGFSLSPAIEDSAPGVCTVDLSGRAPDEREPALRDALARLARLGLRATGGLASTPLVAGYAATDANPVRTVRQPRSFLAALPLATASPPPELALILGRWGVRTLGDLTDLPKGEITRRLGPEGLALWERAAGETIRPLRRVTPARTFVAEQAFETEIESLDPLLLRLRPLVDRLALDLANAGLAAGELLLALALADETRYERAFRLPEATAEPDTLFGVLLAHLESLHTAAPVAAARLEFLPARPQVRQHGLFDTGLRDPRSFADTLARLVAVVGSARLGTPYPEDTHRPDAFRLAPPPAAVDDPPAPPVLPPLGPPLRRFRPPRPATVELGPGAPAYVQTSHVRGPVAAWAGPWCAAGDWWEEARAWKREEWDVALESGGLYRLARTPDGWFVDGEYD